MNLSGIQSLTVLTLCLHCSSLASVNSLTNVDLLHGADFRAGKHHICFMKFAGFPSAWYCHCTKFSINFWWTREQKDTHFKAKWPKGFQEGLRFSKNLIVKNPKKKAKVAVLMTTWKSSAFKVKTLNDKNKGYRFTVVKICKEKTVVWEVWVPDYPTPAIAALMEGKLRAHLAWERRACQQDWWTGEQPTDGTAQDNAVWLNIFLPKCKKYQDGLQTVLRQMIKH